MLMNNKGNCLISFANNNPYDLFVVAASNLVSDKKTIQSVGFLLKLRWNHRIVFGLVCRHSL